MGDVLSAPISKAFMRFRGGLRTLRSSILAEYPATDSNVLRCMSLGVWLNIQTVLIPKRRVCRKHESVEK